MASKLFTFDTDEEAKLVLRREGKNLSDIANAVWDKYISDYTPSKYVRTGNSKKAIKLGRLKRLDAFTFGIELSFRDDLSYHNSVIRASEPKGHSFMLISEGWKVGKGKHKGIKNFGYHEGIDYIGQVTRKFNDSAHEGIKLEVNWAGEPFKKKKKSDYSRVLKG